jgi:hypothetical protein
MSEVEILTPYTLLTMQVNRMGISSPIQFQKLFHLFRNREATLNSGYSLFLFHFYTQFPLE